MRVGPSVAHLDKEPSKWPWEQKRFPKIGNLYFLFDIEKTEQNSMERIGNHRFYSHWKREGKTVLKNWISLFSNWYKSKKIGEQIQKNLSFLW